MKKILITIILAFTFIGVQAQCTPDPQYVSPGIHPYSATGLVDGLVGQAYNEVITVIVPIDTILNGILIDFLDIKLDSIIGLPANFSYSCAPINCSFPAGSLGCISIFSTSNPTVADTGLYHIYVHTTSTIVYNGFQIPIDSVLDYYIEILPTPLTYGCIDSTAFNYDPTATIDDGSCVFVNCSSISGFTSVGSIGDCCYYVSDTTMSWTSANVLCTNSGGIMATINSQQQSDSLNILLGNIPNPPFGPNAHWLGLIDGNIDWENGDPLTFTNYDVSYIPTSGQYMYIQTNGKWDNSPNDGSEGPPAGIYAIMEICAVFGCTDPLACNYDPAATIDDGSCNYTTISVDNVGSHCDTYTWLNGVTYTSSNNSATWVTYDPITGCSNVATLNLTINNITTSVDVQTACDTYTWLNGVTYTASNNSATWVTYDPITGCSNVATLNLTINNSTTSVDVQTACDTYTWLNGVTYTASNNSATWVTYDPITGCSHVATLNLTILATPTAPTATNETVCEGSVIPDLTATGTMLTWYSDAALINVVGNGSPFTAFQTVVGVYTYYVTETNASLCQGPSTTVTLEIFALPSAPIAANAVVCEGEWISLTATGANVTWYDNAALTNVVGNGSSFTTFQTVVGVYTYYVTQNINGCESTAGIATLTVNPLPDVLLAPSNLTCNGFCDGSILASVGGGAPTYTYLWDDLLLQTTATAIGLCAGTYTCIVTEANGCSVSSSVTITEPDIISLITSVTDVSCFGMCDGSALVSATGGTSPYIYSWSNGQTTPAITNLCAGTYTCIVTDANNCADTIIVTVTEPSILSSITSITDVTCNGGNDGSIIVTATGGLLPYEYSLGAGFLQSNGTFTGLTAGAYSVDVTDATNCIVQSIVTIMEPTALSISVDSTDETSALNDGSIAVSATGGNPTYQYSIDGGITWSTSNIFTGLAAGLYNVEVQDANGCTISDSTFVNAYHTTGIINIKNTSKKLLKITDVLGRETKGKRNQPLFYIYDDGTVEKRIVVE